MTTKRPAFGAGTEASSGKETRPPVDAAFATECARQSRLVAEADRDDPELAAFLDAALNDIEGWT